MEGDVQVLGVIISSTLPTETEDGKVLVLQNYAAESVGEGVGLPEVYALTTSTKRPNDIRPIAAQEFTQEQEKVLYCHQASFTLGFLKLRGNVDKYKILTRMAQFKGAVQNCVLLFPRVRLLY